MSRVVKIGADGPASSDSNAVIGADDPLGGYGHPLLTAGRYPAPGRPDEIMLNERGARTRRDHRGRPGPAVGPSLLGRMRSGRSSATPSSSASCGCTTTSSPRPRHSSYVLAGPDLAGGRWREAEQPGTILSLQVADSSDLTEVAGDLSTVVGPLGNVSDQEVDTETIERAPRCSATRLRLAAAVAAAAGAVIVAQAVARHLQRRPSDAVVLGAIGLGRRTRMWAAVAAVLPAVLLGAVAGAGVAAVVSPAFPLGAVRRAEPNAGVPSGPCRARPRRRARRRGGDRRVRRRGEPVGADDAAADAHRTQRWPRSIERLRFRPAAATGARFALDAGHGAQRLPVIPTLLTVTATIAVAAAAIVVHTNLDRMLTTPARFGQPWAFAVSATIDHEDGMREARRRPRVSRRPTSPARASSMPRSPTAESCS